jgi:hypothetical protein
MQEHVLFRRLARVTEDELDVIGAYLTSSATRGTLSSTTLALKIVGRSGQGTDQPTIEIEDTGGGARHHFCIFAEFDVATTDEKRAVDDETPGCLVCLDRARKRCSTSA